MYCAHLWNWSETKTSLFIKNKLHCVAVYIYTELKWMKAIFATTKNVEFLSSGISNYDKESSKTPCCLNRYCSLNITVKISINPIAV